MPEKMETKTESKGKKTNSPEITMMMSEWILCVSVNLKCCSRNFDLQIKRSETWFWGDLFGKCHDSISINEQLNRHQKEWNFWWSGNVSKSI